MAGDREPDRRTESSGNSWPERHLGKIVVVVLLAGLLGIVARALTG